MLSKGEGKATSFVGANFTRAQLQRLPTGGTHAGLGRSNIWLTHMHGTVVHRKLRFGPFELSIGERVLRRDGVVLPLGGRALDILIYLAGRPGEVIAKQELIDHVWLPHVLHNAGDGRVRF